MSYTHSSKALAEPRRRRFAWLSALGLCGLCSCAYLPKPDSTDWFNRAPPGQAAKEKAATDKAVADKTRAVKSSLAQNTARADKSRTTVKSTPVKSTSPGRAKVTSTSTNPSMESLRPLTSPAAVPTPRRQIPSTVQTVQLASDQTPKTDRAVERVAAETRTPAVTSDPLAPGLALNDDGASPSTYPDEYLFDGGDRDYPITRNLDQFAGLETEDTIAQFEDDDGQQKIKKTNRVAIYAPRFGSVVMVSGPNADTTVNKVHGHVANEGGVNLRNRVVTSSKEQQLGTGRMDTRLRANGVGTDISTQTFDREQSRGVEVAVMNTHESRGRLNNEQFDTKISTSLLDGMQFAEIWTRKQNPVIEGHATSGTQSITVQAQASFTGIEDNGKRGDLRLHKTADKGVAAIGDVVTFTIYYENAGDRELKNVSLIDNLTPRLEYVPEGTSTDRPGKVETEDNGEGSVILRFILDKPLPGRTKGSVTFQARVR